MIILDTYITVAVVTIIIWWMTTILISIMAGCGGFDYKNVLTSGFLGTGLILVAVACMIYIISIISST